MTIERQFAFSVDEYRQRVEIVRAQLRARGAEVLLVDETEHLAYLTGFGPSATMYQACIVPLDADPVMVLRQLDVPTFLERTWLSDYVAFGDAADPVAVLATTLRQRGWAERRCYENLNQGTGEGGDSVDSDTFYTWGALLVLLGDIERLDDDPWEELRKA